MVRPSHKSAPTTPAKQPTRLTREVLLLRLLEVEGAVVQRLVVVLLEDLLPRLHHLSLGLRGQREAGTSRRH